MNIPKYESFLVKQNEALFLQTRFSSQKTMELIEYKYGPFDNEEIEFYKERLKDENGEVIQTFQKQLIFNLFGKQFKDPANCYEINKDDYIKLMIAAKRLLLANNMITLPYIISSKVERYQPRKCVNKKELLKIEASPYYEQIYNKYKNDKIIKNILSMIATILASDFRIIEYNDKAGIDGKMISNIPDLISEEVMMYVILT